MADLSYEYEHFYSKAGFNNAATHFEIVGDVLGDFQDKINLADRINLMLNEKEIVQDQIPSLVSALLIDKFGYKSFSYNLQKNFQPETALLKDLTKWKAVDIILVYHHPDLGFTVLNPKNLKHWELVTLFKSNELIVLYAGGFSKTKPGEKLYDKAISNLLDIFNGKTINKTDDMKKGSFKFISIDEEEEPVKKVTRKSSVKKGKAPAPAASEQAASVQEKRPKPQSAAPSKNRRMTPFYSVPVTNELFHNGNVEAWKKVIQSYQTKHKGLDVNIYYDGERIHDIHSLFKWGKVKHGSTILFAVVGEEIKDVAKLQRYLKQGASSRFEDFLKYPVNTVLNLF